MAEKLITVVVPVRDRPEKLERLVQSLRTARAESLTQSMPDTDLVIVDDRSKVSPRLPSGLCATVVKSEGAGPGAARNTGARIARTEWLLFTDSDCTVEPDWLTAGYRHASDPAKSVVQGDPTKYASTSPFGSHEETLYGHMFSTYVDDDTQRTRMLDSRNLLLRRDALLGVGGFDVSGLDAMAESRTLAARFGSTGATLYYASDMVIRHEAPPTLQHEMGAKFRHGRGRLSVWGLQPPTDREMAHRYFEEPVRVGVDPQYVLPVHIAFLAGYSHEKYGSPLKLPKRVLSLVPWNDAYDSTIEWTYEWLSQRAAT